MRSHSFVLSVSWRVQVPRSHHQCNAVDPRAVLNELAAFDRPCENACGHERDLNLSLARIEEAAHVIDPVFLNTPQYADEQLNAALGRKVVVKVETTNPLRSFKGRGADFLMGRFDAGQTVVCSSTGNFGQAMAYAGRRRGVAVEVFVPESVKSRQAGPDAIFRRARHRRRS